MSKSSRTNVRKKVTKNIEKQRTIEIMKAYINPVTNNPNYSKVNNLTGVDRKTLARWWKNREKIASSKNKHSRQNLVSDKHKGKYPEMEDKLDEWTKELREAGCCISGFTSKVKSLQILRETDKFDGEFFASEGWLRGFLRRKIKLLEELLQRDEIYRQTFQKRLRSFIRTVRSISLTTTNLTRMLL
jgi:hypothetical protein